MAVMHLYSIKDGFFHNSIIMIHEVTNKLSKLMSGYSYHGYIITTVTMVTLSCNYVNHTLLIIVQSLLV